MKYIFRLDREDPQPADSLWTWGDLYCDGKYVCCTLEDRVREEPGSPVEVWKVPGQTAIPSGIYRLELQDSPHFGPRTPTVLNVPGFDLIRLHGGTTVADSEGCVLVGSRQDREDGTLHGAKIAQKFGDVVVPPALETLRGLIAAGLEKGFCYVQIRNGPGWYRDRVIRMPVPLP